MVHAVNLVTNFLGVALVAGVISDGATASSGMGMQSPLGVMYGLGSAVASSVTVLMLRRLGSHGLHPVASTFAYGVGCIVVLLVIATPPDAVALVKGNHLGLLCAMLSSVAGFTGQTFLAWGLRYVPAGSAAVVRSLNVPVAFALGLAVFGETVAPTEIVGVFFIVGSVVVVGVMQVMKS